MPKAKGREESCGEISRREFARGAALAAVTAAALPTSMLGQAEKTPPKPEPVQAPALPPSAQAEADRTLQAILAKYGDRLSAQQKSDLRRLVAQQQKSLETLRAFALDNGDQPATVLHLPGLEER